jgi:hypothetical protein
MTSRDQISVYRPSLFQEQLVICTAFEMLRAESDIRHFKVTGAQDGYSVIIGTLQIGVMGRAGSSHLGGRNSAQKFG